MAGVGDAGEELRGRMARFDERARRLEALGVAIPRARIIVAASAAMHRGHLDLAERALRVGEGWLLRSAAAGLPVPAPSPSSGIPARPPVGARGALSVHRPRTSHRPERRALAAVPAGSRGPSRGPGRRPRLGTRRTWLRVSVSVAVTLVMIFAASSATATAHAAPVPVPEVLDLQPVTGVVGSPVTIAANLTGGLPIPAASGVFHGYLVFFFYGESTPNGGLGYDRAVVAPPDSCTSPTTVCSSDAPFSFSHTYERPGSYDVSFTVYDAQGDYAIATDVVTVAPPVLHVAVAANTTTAPEDSPVEFTASTTTVPASYEADQFAYRWQFGDNNSTWGNPVAHAFHEHGDYVVTATAYDNRTGAAADGSLSGLSITNPLPHPAIAVSGPENAGAYYEDAVLAFSASGSRDVPSDQAHLRYLWDFGDGAMGAGISASHEYTESGSFTVTLTVTDEENADATTTVAVQILNSPPVANTSATSSAAVPVGTVALLNGSATLDVPTDAPLLNYSWSTGVVGVTAENATNGIVGREAYFEPGNFTANLTATDEEGASSAAQAPVKVVDVAPNVGVYSAYALANLTLDLAGTPGNTLNVSVLEDGHLVAYGLLTRTHGNPHDDTVTLTDVPFALADRDTIQVSYQGGSPPQGANPVDLFVTFWGDGVGCTTGVPAALCQTQEYTHRFIVQQSDSLTWNVDANAASLGQVVFLNAQLFSPARSNLTASWAFGDAASASGFVARPGVAEPTEGNVAASHRWLPGSDYNMTVSVRDAFGQSASTVVEVVEIADARIPDVAPTVTITTPASLPEAPGVSLSATASSLDYGASTFDYLFAFGDGATAAQLPGAQATTIQHLYRYSDTRYALVVYASSIATGFTTAAWSFLTITNAPPAPEFAAPASAVREFAPIVLDGSGSLDYPGAGPGAGLAFAWGFYDSGGNLLARDSGPVVVHDFTSEGNFSVTLTTTDSEGLSASVTHVVEVADVPTVVTLAPRTVTVDALATFGPASVAGAPTDVSGLDGIWHFGDGSAPVDGLSVGHTYLAPGNFTATLDLYGEDGTNLTEATMAVTVLNGPLAVALPYSGSTVYGENHTAYFTATALGTLADALGDSGSFTYLWSFGDGSPDVTSVGNLTDTVSHVYSLAGNPLLSVTVTSPDGRSATANATVVSVPNWDGDGIPDMYAALVLHLPPANDAASGSGLTDFASAFVVGGQNATADSDHDGLTDFQEVFGAVTGYVSNPLDAFSAGDGMLDGAHEFVDTFSAPQAVQFQGLGVVTIPQVFHPGNLAAVKSVQLFDEVVSATPSALDVSLQEGGGAPIDLGAPTSPVGEYTLLNNSAVGGTVSAYGLALSQFGVPSPWTLTVTGGNGTVESAQILITYYTDPTLADPYGSGLTLGRGLSIPVFNCSEPTDANYTVFDGTTFTYSTVHFYPYTEQYWKLSVVQGLPYYPSENASYSPGGGPGCSVGDPHAWATYHGDREFGIPPWATHYVDPGLTDGMKAYGRATYDLTANHYEGTSGGYVPSASASYPWDSLSYAGPLNPTAYSTGTTGVADSAAIDPAGGPEVFGVTVHSGWSTCVLQGFSLALYPYGQAGVSNLDLSGHPTIYTGGVKADDHHYHTGGACYQWHFSWEQSYQVPVNTGLSSNTLDLGIFLDNAATDASAGSLTFAVSTDPNAGAQSLSAGDCNSFCISATVQAFTLARMPVVLFNSSHEVKSVPGYGERWVGDQHFYAFYLDLSGATGGTPFQPGSNLLLVSRPTFVNSSLNVSLATGQTTGPLACLGGASMSTPSASSDALVVGTLSATVNASCALALLGALVPHDHAGNVTGAYQALSQDAFELLGLTGSILGAAPYFPMSTATFSDQSAGQPSSILQQIGNFLSSVWNAIVSVVIAIGNFVAAIAQAIGQAIVGLWNQVVAAVEAAIQAIVSAFDFILKWIEQKVGELFDAIKTTVKTWIGKAIEAVALPVLSLLVDLGILSLSGFNSTFATLDSTFGISDPSPQSNATAGQEVATFVEVFTGVISGIFALVGLVMYIIDIVSLGTAAAATETASASASAVVAGVVASVFAGIGAIAGLFSVLLAIVPAFGGNDAFSNFINLVNSNTGANLGTQIGDIVVGFLVGVTDLVKALLTAAVSGAYIVGLALGIVSLLVSIFAAIFSSSPLAQLVLAILGLLLGAVSVAVQLYPTTQAADDASETGIADAASMVLGISGAVLGITTLTIAANTCAQNSSACQPA